MFQAENDAKPSQGTALDSFTDCEDITPTQIILALHEKKVKDEVEDDITDCEFTEINTNKRPQIELFENEMEKQVIILHDYKKDKQPFEDIPADNIASEDVPIQIKEVEGVVLNNIKHAKNTFHEVVSLFTIALQSLIRVQSEDITNIKPNATQDFTKDQREKSKCSLVVASNADDEVVLCSIDGNGKNEQDENENTYCRTDLPSQDNMDVLSGNDATLTNVNDSSDEEFTPKKSKRFTFSDSDLPDSDEIRDILMSYPKPTVVESFSESESENNSEDEYELEFLRRFRNKTEPVTIDLIKMIGIEKLPVRIMTRLRKPTFKLLSGGELSKNKSSILKPIYLTKQEDQIDEDIILENIKRLKSFQMAKTYKPTKNHDSIKEENKETTHRKRTHNKNNEHKRYVKVKIEKPARKGKKSKTKTFARNNTKEDSLELNSMTIASKIRSKKKENDGKNIKNKCIFPENKNKEPDHKRKPYKKGEPIFLKIEGRRSKRQQKVKEPDNKRKRTSKKQEKERSVSPEIEVRRSKRHQKVKKKNDDTMKASISILKKSIPKKSTFYNVSSSSSEWPKSLKRSLVDDSDVPSSKRTRSHNNNNNNNSINNASLRATPARVLKHLSAFSCKEHNHDKMDPYVHIVRYEPAQKPIRAPNSNRNYLTRSQITGNGISRRYVKGDRNWVCVSWSKDNGYWPALRKGGATVVPYLNSLKTKRLMFF